MPPTSSQILPPGALRGDVRLTLQTRHAQRLWEGRTGRADRPAIRGLTGFADRTRVLWNAAQADDPYADWFLIRVEDRLKRARALLQLLKTQAEERINSTDLEWSSAHSTSPVRIQLRFATPYAYRGAHLLAAFDGLARRVLTGRFLGVLEPQNAELLLRSGGRCIRAAFDSVNGYRNFAIDREAVLTGTPSAQLAQDTMGTVPAEIMAEERLAALRPQRRHAVDVIDDLDVLAGEVESERETADPPAPEMHVDEAG